MDLFYYSIIHYSILRVLMSPIPSFISNHISLFLLLVGYIKQTIDSIGGTKWPLVLSLKNKLNQILGFSFDLESLHKYSVTQNIKILGIKLKL